MTREEIYRHFPEGYWDNWHKQFRHNFESMHINRTIEFFAEYARHFDKLKVLEIGGFPGLNIAMYKEAGARVVDAIDSPKYRPDWYLDWCKEQTVPSTAHDIVQGIPPQSIRDKHWDVAVMMDVLLHINGVPVTFLDWLSKRADWVIIGDQPRGASDDLVVATDHSLERLYPLPHERHLIALLTANGLVQGPDRKIQGRNMLQFRRQK